MNFEIYLDFYKQKKFEEAIAYKSTQIPTRLFKYYSLTENKDINESKLKYLQESKIFLSEFSGFNDPFEGKLFRFDEEKLRKCGWDKNKVERYYNSLKSGFKYACFSKTNENNMPMWAYYANNHQGFCVEYIFCDKQKKYIFPVTYEPERVYANVLITNLIQEYANLMEQDKSYKDVSADGNVYAQMVIFSLAAKHKSWAHEKEYRIICNGMDSFPAIPSKIYIGMNCKEAYQKKLVKIGTKIDGCKVYKMEVDESSQKFDFRERLIN